LLYVSGEDNRTMVYALSTGKQLRQMFGEVEAVDPETGRVCTGNRRDEAVVYDAEGKELAHYHLGDAIRFGHFRNHGKELVVLTADQTVWTLKVDAAVQEQVTK
jgi:myo-inositol-hexaphosphate 3-phosphohydrolase